MRTHILPALKLTLLCILFFVVLYPALIWGIAVVAAPDGGKGDLENVGQSFTSDHYFWSRPSAVNYNGAGSGGSNKGPSNPDYLKTVQERIDTFLVHNPKVKKAEIPSELVTASGSGLDPHISPNAAKVQIPRIASVRGLSEERLIKLVDENTHKPLLGLFGTSTINVLKLNKALDLLK
ncbi:MAG TPA: potassium-transporting ATPase subunit C [Cytophagaceae bacterium]|jgi:K+-transporting ATPase ATPase C chain|nr:potassium-transporting ATPase subunit C [Cytophagaceae bacterium]